MMIRSMVNFEALIFLLGPAHSMLLGHFNYVDAVPRSALPSSVFVSSTSCPYEDVVWPSFSFVVATSTTYATATTSIVFFYSAAFYFASYTGFSLVAAISCCLFSANWVMRSLASSFFFCVVGFSNSTRSGAHHSGGHVSKTMKMASLVAINERFVHCFIVSLCALMYTLCMSALNSIKLCKILYTLRDRHDL